MKTILHIDSSNRGLKDQETVLTENVVPQGNSISKAIAASFIDSWLAINSEDKVIHRDVGISPPDFISQSWVEAAFTPDDERSEAQQALLSTSDTLIDELEQADIIVMSSPMYNYGMPAQLKAWLDQVVRVNKTFTFDLSRGDFPLEPIMSGKTLVLTTSSGEFGFSAGGVREAMNHLGPHLKTASRYLGVENFHEINAEYQEFGDDRHVESVSKALMMAKSLAREIANENETIAY